MHEDMIELLTSNALGTFGDDFYWGTMPPDPDEVLVGYERPAPGGLYAKTGGAARTEGRLQFLTRAPDYGDAMARAVAVYDFLDDRRWTADDTTYHTRAVQRPFDVGGTDENDRTIVSCNFSLTLMEG